MVFIEGHSLMIAEDNIKRALDRAQPRPVLMFCYITKVL